METIPKKQFSSTLEGHLTQLAGHGGKREGAGRIGHHGLLRKGITVYIPPHVAEWLFAQCASRLTSQLIIDAYESANHDPIASCVTSDSL